MIKILFLDVDGTLTDGQIYMGNNGEAFKSFHAHDAVGLRKLPINGVETVIITGREGRKLKKKKLKSAEAAYIGDDENDYESMLLCQYKACPKNATSKIKNIANFISNYDGGLGAVREYCEYILASNIKN